jgi:hypothetical protein
VRQYISLVGRSDRAIVSTFLGTRGLVVAASE